MGRGVRITPKRLAFIEMGRVEGTVSGMGNTVAAADLRVENRKILFCETP